NENLDFGFLGASEADEQFSQGKDFYAFRARKNADNYSLGYLGTYTERPVLDRQATVHSVDLTYRPTDKLRIDTVLINSNIDQGLDGTKTSGQAFRFRLTASPSKGRWHDMGAYFFDDEVDISDMGYQMTDNWFFVGNQNGLKFTGYDESSALLSSEIEAGWGVEGNADLDKAGHSVYVTYRSSFKNTSGLEFTNFYRSSNKDFWITRDSAAAPYIDMPENYGTTLQFMGPSTKFLSYGLGIERGKGSQWSFSALGFATNYKAMINITPKDNLSFSLMYHQSKEDD
ncbi:MAG: hypothetical protein HOL98_13530, partial [Gammaproteobacteria bacterium]|nr:hypothetical protein [Gammaproteobacteria bacterium]